MPRAVRTVADQFVRTAVDVADALARHGRIPSAVWLGAVGVPPEAFLRALAGVAQRKLAGRNLPRHVTVPTARLAAADHVASDGPDLWGWETFPRGFRAPAMMELAKRQAWTLKPAIAS
jgi:dipeptidyl aminopeptidase/acylaminoacyl peptidase